MYGKQALTNFYRLNFANKSGWFIYARVYIFLLQVALLVTLLLSIFSGTCRVDLWQKVIRNILIPLDFASVPLHTLVCSVIGMDKIYILHLICSGIYWNCQTSYRFLFVSENPDYVRLVASILSILAYWIFNFRTRILYLSTFRFSVNNTSMNNRTLFRRIFKWWILVHLVLVPYIIWLLFHPKSNSIQFHLMRALFISFELKMYLALTPDIEKWSYIFSTRSYLLEKFYVFCVLFHFFSCLTGLASDSIVPYQVKRSLKIIGETMWAIRWVWLYFYAKEKLEDFVFQCIDEDSDSDFFDEFEFASKTTNPWKTISEYEPKRTLEIVNV